MRRIDEVHSSATLDRREPLDETNTDYAKDHISIYYKGNQTRILEPYPNPIGARLMNWFFVKVLLYRPPYYYVQKQRFRTQDLKGKGKSKESVSGASRVTEGNQEETAQTRNGTPANMLRPNREDAKTSSPRLCYLEEPSSCDLAKTTSMPEHSKPVLSHGLKPRESSHIRQGNHVDKTPNIQHTSLIPGFSPNYSNRHNNQSCFAAPNDKKILNTEKGAICEPNSKTISSYSSSTPVTHPEALLRVSATMETKEMRSCFPRKAFSDYGLRLNGNGYGRFSGAHPSADRLKSTKEGIYNLKTKRTSSAALTIASAPPSVFSRYSPRPILKQGMNNLNRRRITSLQKKYRKQTHSYHSQYRQIMGKKQYGTYQLKDYPAYRLGRRNPTNRALLGTCQNFGDDVIYQYTQSQEKNENEGTSDPEVIGSKECHKYVGSKVYKPFKEYKVVLRHSPRDTTSFRSGQQQQQRSLMDRGLSPPSKRHYEFAHWRVFANINQPNPTEIEESGFQTGQRRTGLSDLPTSCHRPFSQSYDNGASNQRITDKARAEIKAYGTFHHNNLLPCDAGREIVFSGARTVLVHISNTVYTVEPKETDFHQQYEANRITTRIGPWVADYTSYHIV